MNEKITVWDFANSINTTKQDIIRESDSPNIVERLYDPFVINRTLSYFPDTIEHAMTMNNYASLPKRWQFDYLINIVRRRKRRAKWAKPEKDDVVMHIAEHYNTNLERAKEIISILPQDAVDEIITKRTKGG